MGRTWDEKAWSFVWKGSLLAGLAPPIITLLFFAHLRLDGCSSPDGPLGPLLTAEVRAA